MSGASSPLPGNRFDRRGRRLAARHTSRDAFTLVEVLIALGLTVLLLSAVYTAIDLHYRYSTAGRAEIAGGQLRRAVSRRISEDITSIVMQLPEEEQASSGSQAASEDSGETTSSSEEPAQLGGLSESGSPMTFGLVGTDQFMHLTISRPSRDLAYSGLYSETAVSGRSSDLLIATWGIGPVSKEFWDLDERSQKFHRPMTGLAHRLADLYAPDPVSDTLEPEHVIAPEITEIQIRYYDGVAWLDSWDSRTTGTLPRAIEVTLGFWSEPVQNQRRELNYLKTGTVQHVPHVFHVPLSTPATGEAAL